MAFGPTFAAELKAAGLLGLPFTWDPDRGVILNQDDLTPAQRTALAAVVTNHNAAALTNKLAMAQDTNFTDLQSKLANATPAQVATYVNNNVTDLASAKVLLTKIILVLAYIWGSQS